MRFLKSPKFSMLLPYLLLAVVVIIVFRVVSEIQYVFSALSWFFGVMSPFFYGFLLAYVLNIPCTALQKLYGRVRWGFIARKKKGLSIISVYLFFLLLIFFVLNLIVPQIYNSVSYFIANFQTYYETAMSAISYIGVHFDVDLSTMLADQFSFENILAMLQGFQSDGNNFVNDVLFGTLANISTAIFRMFLALISSLYILLGKDAFQGYLRRGLVATSPTSVSAAVLKYGNALNQNFKQYIYTQTIDGLILGTVTTIVLTIMGSPYALLLGLMLGVFNYIPYFGSIVATLISILVVALTQGLTMGLIATVVLIILQQLDANVLQPKLMSGSFSLSPLLVIISITVGGAMAGMLGMIAAIPIMAVLKDLLDTYIAYRERVKVTDGADLPPDPPTEE